MEMSDLIPTPQELLLRAIFNVLKQLPCPVLWTLPDPNSDAGQPDYPFIVLSTTTNQESELYKNARTADIDVYIDIYTEKQTRAPVERLTHAARSLSSTVTVDDFSFARKPTYSQNILTDNSTGTELWHGSLIANYLLNEKEW
jgi:hypothetical protein